jgi:hypothetical protein
MESRTRSFLGPLIITIPLPDLPFEPTANKPSQQQPPLQLPAITQPIHAPAPVLIPVPNADPQTPLPPHLAHGHFPANPHQCHRLGGVGLC